MVTELSGNFGKGWLQSFDGWVPIVRTMKGALIGAIKAAGGCIGTARASHV